MSLVIPDEFFQTAQISEADLKLEIAILLFRQEKIALSLRV
jgi:predicted HTH domain antitoxin